MNGMYSYPLWLAVCAVVPIVLLWAAYGSRLKPYGRMFFSCVCGALLLAIPWDYISVQEHIWYFTRPHVSGLWFLGLPIEEWVFITLVTLLFSTITVLTWEKYGDKTYVR